MGGFISTSNLEQIRAASDIVDVIGSHLQLKRAGGSFVALCPFHKEKTPSFHVNPQRQTFHCFGCHKGGDVFTFIKEYENVDFTEAVRRLAERANIPLEYDQMPGQAQARDLKDALLSLHEQVAQRWQQVLASDRSAQVARDYLLRRGVSAEAVKLFRLGYAPDQWEDTVNWLNDRKIDLALAEQAGLIVRKEGDKGHYDRFKGRLMFPICDEQGRVVAFSGRVLVSDAKMAKYVNSPETPIFAKRKIFYGLDKSKRALIEAKQAIICEGQLDLIACYMAGVHNIVAPQGTAFTAEHARILRRFVPEVVLCFDADSAGQSAAVRVLDDLLGSGLAIRVATLPAPHDPDSFIKEFGGAAFQQLMVEAPGFFDFYLGYLCQRYDPAGDRGRMEIVRAMGEALQKTNNQVLLDTHAQKTAIRLGISMDAVRKEFARPSTTRPMAREPEEELAPAEEVVRPTAREYWLLKYLFLEECDPEYIQRHLDPNWIEHAGVKEIVQCYLSARQTDSSVQPAGLLGALSNDPTRALLTESLADARPIPHAAQQLQDVLVHLRNRLLDQQLVRLTQALDNPELSENQRVDLITQYTMLRQQKQQPLEPRN